MKILRKTGKYFLLILFVFFVLCISVSAQEDKEYIGNEEIEFPLELDFTINESCSNHLSFMQASACKNGWFLVFSRNIDADGYPNSSMKKVYIDIYDTNGHFYKEISFSTAFYVAAEMTETAVNIIFQDFVVVFDLGSDVFRCYSVLEDADITQLFLDLRKETFRSGEWEYRCIKSTFTGYKTLLRYNENTEQVLIDMPGFQNTFVSKARIGGIIGLVVFAIGVACIIVNKKYAKRKIH